jgi:hypothetical protein
VVTGADSGDGQRPDGAADLTQRPEILDAKDVVGAVQQPGQGVVFGQLGEHLRPGRRIGQPRTQQAGGTPGQFGRMLLQQVGTALKAFEPARLAAETERIDTAQGIEGTHRPFGEARRAVAGPGKGELHHHVDAGSESHPSALPLVDQRRLAALQEVPAHHCHRHFGAGRQPALPQMMQVAVVEGVVFGDQADGAHKCP